MPGMDISEVQKLAQMARIRLSDEEAAALTGDIDSILDYVSDVQAVAGTDAVEPTVGAVHNVFREDEVTNEPEQYTDTLLKAMPETDGRFKKILSNDD
jgi:aspartyl-tRNA(Asn)/glutamyl-tRNA(Gln) amidotransferase subunit C